MKLRSVIQFAIFAILFVSNNVFAKWVVDANAGLLKNGEITITYEDDKNYPGGIVLKRVKSFPAGEWSLNSLEENFLLF